MITRYQLSVLMEFATQADRDAAYTRLKTAAQSEKATGKTTLIQIDKREYTQPESSTEVI